MEDSRLRRARETVESGGCPTLNCLRMIHRSCHSSEEVLFLEPLLEHANESVRMTVLEILCTRGVPVADYVERLGEMSSVMTAKVISLAEKQNDPMTILQFASVDNRNAHMAVIALKRMGETSLLTGFLLSSDTELSKLVGDLS